MAISEEARKAGEAILGAVILMVFVYWILKGATDTDWWLINVQYSDADSVVLEPKPIDCDKETAPQGEKGCHYQRYVFVDREGGRITRVHGTWKRVADNQEPTVVNRTRAAAPAHTDATIGGCINRNNALRTSQDQDQAILDGCSKDTAFTIVDPSR
jgi:hypothetical protein